MHSLCSQLSCAVVCFSLLVSLLSPFALLFPHIHGTNSTRSQQIRQKLPPTELERDGKYLLNQTAATRASRLDSQWKCSFATENMRKTRVKNDGKAAYRLREIRLCERHVTNALAMEI